MKASRLAAAVILVTAAMPLLLAARCFRFLADLRHYPVAGSVLAEATGLGVTLALAGGLSLAGLGLRPAHRANLALALGSAAAALYGFEVLDTLPGLEARRFQEKLGLVESLNRSGRHAYGGVRPVAFVAPSRAGDPTTLNLEGRSALPLAGISLRTTVDCKEVEGAPWLVFKADEHGFNNPPGLWARAPVELAAVGDSLTAGNCVPPDRNMVARLRQRFPSSLNLGMAGSGPLLMLAQVREFLPLAQPRLLLWCHFGGNDMGDLRREREHPILVRYLTPGFRQGLPERQPAVDAALEQHYQEWLVGRGPGFGQASLWGLLTLRATRTRLALTFPAPQAFAATEQELRLFHTILAQALATLEAWDGRLYFVYLPAWNAPRTLAARARAGLDAETRRQVLAIAEGLGLPMVDLSYAFATHPDPASLFACPGCHYSAAGYRLAADTILAALGRDPSPQAFSGRAPGSAADRRGSPSSP